MRAKEQKADRPAHGENKPRSFLAPLIAVISACCARYYAKQEQHEINEAALVTWTRRTAYGTWAAVIVAAGAAGLLIVQLRDGRGALVQSQRAWLFPTNFRGTGEYDPKTRMLLSVHVDPEFENTGNTPAITAGCLEAYGPSSGPKLHEKLVEPTEFSNVGPRQNVYCGRVKLDAPLLKAIWEKRDREFIVARAEYSDAFDGTPRRHTEFCYEVILLRDPSAPVSQEEAAATNPDILTFEISDSICNTAN